MDCSVTGALVVLTQSEYVELGGPFSIDIASAVAIAQSILLVWGVAYVIRLILKFLRPGSEPETDD